MFKLTLSYYPDITQYKSLDEIRDSIVKFAKILEENYSNKISDKVSIKVLSLKTVKEQTEIMVRGDCSIGLMKPVSYVLAHNENADIIPAAVAWRLINGEEKETYYAQLYTRKDSGITSLSDAKWFHRIGFGNSFSTSNFLIPAAELIKNGIHPFTSFRKIEFFGGHDHVAKAVYLKDTDIGAGHDGVIHLLSQVPGFEDANEELIPLKTIDIHSDPIAVNKRHVPDLSLFSKSLSEISQQKEVVTLLENFWGNVTKLGPTKDKNYKSIKDAIQALSLSKNFINN